MTQVLKTQEDSQYDVTISGVGVLPAGGRGGIPAEQAALVMHELQDEDGVPLEGAALTTAARALASARGWQLVSMKTDEIAGLAQEAGAAPDRPPARDVSLEEGAQYRQLTAVNDNPDQVVEAGPDVAPAPPPEEQHQEGREG